MNFCMVICPSVLSLKQYKFLNWNRSSKSFLRKMHTVLCASLLKPFYFEAQKEHLIFIYNYEGNPLITEKKKEIKKSWQIQKYDCDFGKVPETGEREWCFYLQRVFDCCIYSINSSSMANVILCAFACVWPLYKLQGKVFWCLTLLGNMVE